MDIDIWKVGANQRLSPVASSGQTTNTLFKARPNPELLSGRPRTNRYDDGSKQSTAVQFLTDLRRPTLLSTLDTKSKK